jgi:conjugal transfer pilus assembly protein TraU
VLDVAWQSIFPIKIAGVRIGMNTQNVDTPDLANLPVCVCPLPPPAFIRPGIPISFYEPSILLETVKDPFCIPSMGFQMMSPSGSMLSGSGPAEMNGKPKLSTIQGHYYKFPIWAMMEIFTDFICVESGSFDVGWMTEIDPLWQEDVLMMIFQPEALLFANPIAQLSCVADSVGSQVGLPIDALFWCAGSQGSIYPLTGHVLDGDYVQSQMAAAARMVYKQARMLQLFDGAVNICAKVPTPIWIKSHYRYQVAKPVRGIGAIAVGRSSLLWGSLKNPMAGGTGSPDNFSWIVFKKRVCCAF